MLKFYLKFIFFHFKHINNINYLLRKCNQVYFPTVKHKKTVIKSPFVHKKSKDQLESFSINVLFLFNFFINNSKKFLSPKLAENFFRLYLQSNVCRVNIVKYEVNYSF